MKRLFLLFLIFLIFVSGCFQPSLRSIVKNPDRAINECNKYEDVEETKGCLMKFAKDVSLISKETSIIICNNLESGYGKNKCLFGVFSNLEASGRLDEGIEVCKHIEKEGFLEFCERRREGGSIMVAPSLA